MTGCVAHPRGSRCTRMGDGTQLGWGAKFFKNVGCQQPFAPPRSHGPRRYGNTGRASSGLRPVERCANLTFHSPACPPSSLTA